MTECPECRHPADGDFCDACGARIDAGSAFSPDRTAGKHRSPGLTEAADSQTCPVCGATMADLACRRCGYRIRPRRPFAPLAPPEASFTPAGAYPSAGPSAGPPESLFPPVARPERSAPPWELMESPSSSWSFREPQAAPGGPARPPAPPAPAESAEHDLLASLFSPQPAPPAPAPVAAVPAASAPLAPAAPAAPVPVVPPPSPAPVAPVPAASVPPAPPASPASPAPPPRPEPPAAVLAPAAPPLAAPSRPEPGPVSAARAITPASPAPATTPIPSLASVSWAILIASDRAYYDRGKATRSLSGSGVAFPDHVSERRVPLAGKQMRIGRRSATRELKPEIDLADPPADPGISRLHAVLTAAPDGTWSILDPGSANGTLLNGRQIAVGEPVTLHEGDRINLGAWTVITMHRGYGSR